MISSFWPIVSCRALRNSRSKLQTIVLTSRSEETERFYRDVLGLPIKGRSHAGVTFDVGWSDLLVGRVPSTQRSEHTMIAFAVPDLDAAIARLTSNGVSFERFPGFPRAVRRLCGIATRSAGRLAP